jgi:flagellar hook protein FlgE
MAILPLINGSRPRWFLRARAQRSAAEIEPDLAANWLDPEVAPAEEGEVAGDSRDLPTFYVCEQEGFTAADEPLFGEPFPTHDDQFELTGDGYLINSAGQFVMGIPLRGASLALPGERAEVIRLREEALPAVPTSRITYRANLPCFPLTAAAEFDVDASELLGRQQFARDPSTQGSGLVLADEEPKFLARSLPGGMTTAATPQGIAVVVAFRWAKIESLRSCGQDWWNLFYRVRRTPHSGEVAWKNIGHNFLFDGEGRLKPSCGQVAVTEMAIEGLRFGAVAIAFGSTGLTQFADRSGLVKVYELAADGYVSGDFRGISLSASGRLIAHYSNGERRALYDLRIAPGDLAVEDADANVTAPESELSRLVA